MNNSIAIAGIHTGIGKTIASAVIAEAMGADYWKPVQAGKDERDALLVAKLLSAGASRVHAEALVLSSPMSPHAAAAIDKVTVDYTTFAWPRTDRKLLVETAGGVLSPMSDTTTMADFISYYKLPTLLIVQHYLGSINHTLLSIEVLKNRGIHLMGIVLNGPANESSETFIAQYTRVPIIARIPQLAALNNETVAACAADIRQSLEGID